MSTVTLSNPHCAITSAENPDGIASQAFTTALPEAQAFVTLFVATLFPSLLCIHAVIARSQRVRPAAGPMINSATKQSILCLQHGLLRCARNDGTNHAVARWMLTSLTPTSRAVFTIAAQVSSGKGTPFLVRSARIFRSESPGISTGSPPETVLVARIKST